MVDSPYQGEKKDASEDPKRDSFDQHIDDFTEEMGQLGKKVGKQVGKHIEKKTDVLGKHWDSWWDKTFKGLGPVVITVIWLLILGVALEVMRWAGGRFPVLLSLRSFLFDNIFLLIFVFLFFSFAAYFHRKHHHVVHFISPVTIAVGVTFVFWFMINIFTIIEQSYPSLFFGTIANIMTVAFPIVVLIVLIVGYIGMAFSTVFGKIRHLHYPHRSHEHGETEEADEEPAVHHEEGTYHRLFRSGNNRVIAGVCGGLSGYLDIDPVVIRVLVAIGLFVSFGTLLLLYLLMWIIIPRNPDHSWK